jgi:class 3 adenylate cyclase/tetratricopeptide (TPR) repeat protein
MDCRACGFENLEAARFCGGCGGSLAPVVTCAECGADSPSSHRFCHGCGAPLGDPGQPAAAPAREPRDYTPRHLADKILRSRSALEGERKQVTVLFADLKGSMELTEQLDPEEWHRILGRFFEILTEGVHRFEGTVNQYTGDGIMALFGAPIAHEDHAQRACYAALWLRDELQACAREIKREHGVGVATRLGLHSGEVVVGKIGDDLRMDYTAQGHTVGLAQRMESLAEPNTCYLTGATAGLVAGYFALDDLGEFAVKGVSEPAHVFQLTGTGQLQTRFDVSRSRGLSRFVGRQDDMQTLDAALEQATAGNGQVVGIVAEAGTGKSRLCFEFLERCRASGKRIQVGRAVAHGKNIPYLPMLEAFRGYFGIEDSDPDQLVREKIAGRLLLTDESFREFLPILFEFFGVLDPRQPPPRMDPEAKQRQIFATLRKEIQEGNRDTQLVTLLEDLHWFDPGSEAFLEQWIDAIAGSSALLVVNFRPEYTAPFASRSYYRQIPLAPLGPEAVRELLDDLLGNDPSTRGLAEAIHARTGGNPFFTEEVVQSLIESGHLEGARGSYRLVTPVERLEVPASVQALLAARIDSLGEAEKRVLQTAAVIGKDFSEPILIAAGDLDEATVRDALRLLKDAEFIYEQSLYPVPEYTFKHPLTQQVALESQLQERRRRTHADVARALEKAHAERLDENAALLAHHWEQAHEDAVAAGWHRRAARWTGTSDVRESLRHWRRVHELVRDPERTEDDEVTPLAVEACSQILSLGWRLGASEEECERVFEEGRALAEQADDLGSLADLLANYSGVRGLNSGSASDYVRYAEEATRVADRTGDAELRCGARGYLVAALLFSGDTKRCLATCDEVDEISEGDPHRGARISGFSPLLTARMVRLRAAGYGGDPATFLRDHPAQVQLAADLGYPEMTNWFLMDEVWFSLALGRGEGAQTRAREGMRRAETQPPLSAIAAHLALCAALSGEGDWDALLEESQSLLRTMRETRVVRTYEASALDLLAVAQLALGQLREARATAAEAVAFLERNGTVWVPRQYATLVRAQLALDEPAADVERTLADYERLIEHTRYRLLEGPLHECHALLAERADDRTARAAALGRARDVYTACGMTRDAERVARELAP